MLRLPMSIPTGNMELKLSIKFSSDYGDYEPVKIPPNPPLSKGGTQCNHFKISPLFKGWLALIYLRPIAETPGAGQQGYVVAERFRIYPTRFISCARLMPRRLFQIGK
jgi:hypothetical protein